MNASVNYRPNGRVAYSDVGDRAGRPILVQHGLIASIDDSHLFERLIASGRRVTHGRSNEVEISLPRSQSRFAS